MNFAVSYYDRYPIDPKARFDIHRTTFHSDTVEGVQCVFAANGKETIDIVPSPVTEEDKALLWVAEQTNANERALREFLNLMEEWTEWYDHLKTQEYAL